MIRTGLVGFGNIGHKHQLALSRLDEFELVGICDAAVQDIKLPVPFYNSISELLEKEKPDLIAVCTPNWLHEEHAIEALKKGCDVLCEKPLTINSEAARRMINVAGQEGRKIFCVMQNRYSPVSQWLKAVIDSGKLGKIYMINVACYWNRNEDYYKDSGWRGKKERDGGTLFTQFSHYIDSLYWLFGPLKITNAIFENFSHAGIVEFEDSAVFNFLTESGTLGSFSYTTSAYRRNFESTMTIIAEKGSIKIAGQYMNEIEHCDVDSLVTEKLAPSDNIRNLSMVYKNAAVTMRGEESKVSNAEDGAAVVDIIERVYSFKK